MHKTWLKEQALQIAALMYHQTVPTSITVMLKRMTGWQKLPLQEMCRSYNKYNANRTRNVAYYFTSGLCLVMATQHVRRKKKFSDFQLKFVDVARSKLGN